MIVGECTVVCTVQSVHCVQYSGCTVYSTKPAGQHWLSLSRDRPSWAVVGWSESGDLLSSSSTAPAGCNTKIQRRTLTV